MINTVIVGAGPYGLSIAAHLRYHGVPFRIFGRPMDSWAMHMPKGMMLKSDGFASNISDPEGQLTLKKFCAERGVQYADTGIPVSLDTFTDYGLTFGSRMLPELENKIVTSVDRDAEGFVLKIDDGETVRARRVVLAVGITHFEYVPEALAQLPAEYLSHSGRHGDVDAFQGRKVAVVGGGASALDWAGLLHDAGVDVQLIARQPAVKFHGKPSGKKRSLWERLLRPQTGIGPGWRFSFCADAPSLFYYLPENLRLEIVSRMLGPSGGWSIKEKVIGKVPLLLGHSIERAEVINDRVRLYVRSQDGSQSTVDVDHVISATGYKVDLDRLQFLSPGIRTNLKSVKNTPILASNFESSVPGLYFAGISAANTFGPVLRFAYGADFNAKTVARALTKSLVREPAREGVAEVATAVK